MIRNLNLLSAILSTFVLLLTGARGPQTAPLTVRVLTYNIRHGEGTDGRINLERLAGVMKSVQPDIVALQEVDQGTERAGGVHQLAELERLLGMHGEFGKAMDYEGGGYGVAVLSRWPIVRAANYPLPGSPGQEPRTALNVHVRVGERGPLLRFTSTHLDQSRDTGGKLIQARYLNELLVSGDGQPSILAGDLNTRPGTDVMEIFDWHWTNGVAADPPPPGRRGPRGDYVLFRPAERWRVVESRVIDDTVASDHRPVLTVMEWIGDNDFE